MNNTLYPIAVIGVVAAVTWALRAFPFLLFGNRPLPKVVRYLGKALPPAIMTVLVIYCLRDTHSVSRRMAFRSSPPVPWWLSFRLFVRICICRLLPEQCAI